MKYIILFVFTSFFSCDYFSETWQGVANENEDVGNVEEDSIMNQVVHPLYITNVDQLRLRKYPDTKSGIITTLDENSILFSLKEKTDYKESIGKHTAPWLKVMTNNENVQGWVYGAPFFVSNFLSEEELDSIHQLKKEIQIFEHKGKRDMNELTGANWGKAIPGTRFSGYYTYNTSTSNISLNGKVIIRARIFDIDKKEVKYLPCSLDMKNGMPMSDVLCLD